MDVLASFLFGFALAGVILGFAFTLMVQRMKKSAEMRFYQAQIKPHFLFNAIHAILAVFEENGRKGMELLYDLSVFLRQSFDFKDVSPMVPFSRELEIVRAYLNIELARFGNKLRVHIDIPEDWDAMLPVLVLQPLVENAIVHGILPKEEGGEVRIEAWEEAGKKIIRVKDDGVGMSSERLEQVLSRKGAEGVGLYNIRQRMGALRGAAMDIRSFEGEGTEVTLRLPLRSGNFSE